MLKILVTGGTVFASRFTAEYFAENNEVWVLNRNSRPQSVGVKLINADRHSLSDVLKDKEFDAVLDITAYNENDTKDLLNALGSFGCYILVSSSAVYPDTASQPFSERTETGSNSVWGSYGTDKIAAENYLIEHANAPYYILRPPYLYGKMNNIYREAFVFECAERDKPFYVPDRGEMLLQFFDIEDMCRFMEILIAGQPEQRIFNVGNFEAVSICQWVRACYSVLGKEPEFVYADKKLPQRAYFPFYNYSYILDVFAMGGLMPEVKPLEKGLEQSYKWFAENREQIRRKNFFEYLSENMQ